MLANPASVMSSASLTSIVTSGALLKLVSVVEMKPMVLVHSSAFVRNVLSPTEMYLCS